MSLGERLQELRKSKGFTQEQLAKLIGVAKSTLAGYEKNNREPNVLMIKALAVALDTTGDYLIGNEYRSNPSEFSKADRAFIEKFNTLDPHGKEVVSVVLDKEYERIKSIEREKMEQERLRIEAQEEENTPFAEDEDFSEELIEMKVYNQPSAAGLGAYLAENSYADYEMLSFPVGEIPRHADFGIRINGHSMEPTISDGEIVWVEAMPEVENGEVGVFIHDGQAYCKQIHIDRGKQVTLISHNDEYKDIVIIIEDMERLKTVGRVIY